MARAHRQPAFVRAASEGLMSILEDESALRWGFLEDGPDACAVVSDRMELVYLNRKARDLVPADWFGRRCFEILPTADELCVLHCPTVTAVHEAHEIRRCNETLRNADGQTTELDVAVIPLEGMSEDEARAVLLLRLKEDPAATALLADARRLRGDLRTRFQH